MISFVSVSVSLPICAKTVNYSCVATIDAATSGVGFQRRYGIPSLVSLIWNSESQPFTLCGIASLSWSTLNISNVGVATRHFSSIYQRRAISLSIFSLSWPRFWLDLEPLDCIPYPKTNFFRSLSILSSRMCKFSPHMLPFPRDFLNKTLCAFLFVSHALIHPVIFSFIILIWANHISLIKIHYLEPQSTDIWKVGLTVLLHILRRSWRIITWAFSVAFLIYPKAHNCTKNV